jgi:hypothetical protein
MNLTMIVGWQSGIISRTVTSPFSWPLSYIPYQHSTVPLQFPGQPYYRAQQQLWSRHL